MHQHTSNLIVVVDTFKSCVGKAKNNRQVTENKTVLTNQLVFTNLAVLNPKIQCHTTKAQQVGIKPMSPPTKVVALPTKPQTS